MMFKPSTIELDPQQIQWWKEALNQPLTLLEVKTSRDKRWMQQLLMSALSQGEKCLILNFDSLTIDFFLAALQELQLEQHCFSFSDKKNLDALDFEKKEIKKSKKTSLEPAFELHYKQLLRSQVRLEKKYEAARAPVFANLSWPDVLGLFLAEHQEQGKEIVTLTRSSEGFNFTQEELTNLFKMLDTAQQLYQQVPRFDHPFRQLHPHIFLKKKESNALHFCQHKLKVYQQRIETTIQKYQQCIDHYSFSLRRHLEQQTKVFLNQVDHLLDQIEDKTKLYGARFLEAKLGKIKWYAPLSNQGKSAINDYKNLIKAYAELKKNFERIRWFSFSWPTDEKVKTIAPIKMALQAFERALKQGHVNLGQFLQEEEVRLNAKAALPELQQSQKIAQLEEEMDDLLNELNETELLGTLLENKMLTLSKRKQYLSQVQQQLEQLEQHLPDFSNFYTWQRFWLQQPELHQNLVRNLIENKSKNWSGAFQLWYWQQILLVKKSIDLPVATAPLEEYHGFWQKYQAQLPAQIEACWQDSRVSAQEQLKKWRKNGQTKNSASWQEAELKMLSNFFPILIGQDLDKNAFSTHFSETIFDWVIVCDATEDELAWYQRLGKKVLLFETRAALEAADQAAQESSSWFSKTQASEGFWNSFENTIRPYFGAERLQRSWQIDGIIVPLVLKPAQAGYSGFVFLQDGFLSTSAATDFAWEYLQQEKLHEQQWEIVPVWSALCWQNLNEECRRIAAQIISKEKRMEHR